jgi:VanZ family protein
MKESTKRKIAIIPITLSVSIMVLIFMFSAQEGDDSADISIQVTRLYAGIMFSDFTAMSDSLQDEIVDGLHVFVRKLAHFGIYALLGLNVFFSVALLLKRLKNQLLLSLLICVVYASFDEIHQYFKPGRGASIYDVLLDTVGASFGILAGFIVVSIIYYIKKFNGGTKNA